MNNVRLVRSIFQCEHPSVDNLRIILRCDYSDFSWFFSVLSFSTSYAWFYFAYMQIEIIKMVFITAYLAMNEIWLTFHELYNRTEYNNHSTHHHLFTGSINSKHLVALQPGFYRFTGNIWIKLLNHNRNEFQIITTQTKRGLTLSNMELN